jgi:hypothetical protein
MRARIGTGMHTTRVLRYRATVGRHTVVVWKTRLSYKGKGIRVFGDTFGVAGVRADVERVFPFNHQCRESQ